MEKSFETSIPEGFVPSEQWPEDNLSARPPTFQFSLEINLVPKGLRWGFWPLFFEKYISDIEPDLSKAALVGTPQPRFVMWSRVSRTDIPKGWRQFSKRPAQTIGFADLSRSTTHSDEWSATARRYRKKWLEIRTANEYAVEEISVEAYAAAYKQGTVYSKIGANQLEYTLRHAKRSGKHLTLYGARNQHGDIKAGIAVLWSTTCSGTYYISGFIHQDATKVPLMIGLMDHWHTEARMKNIRFVHLGLFWTPGEDKYWKGFSEFKKQFCTHMITFPPLLWRWMPGRLF